jgi:molecular chaperone GrpE
MAQKEQSEHAMNSSVADAGQQDGASENEANHVVEAEPAIDVEALQAELDEARAKADDYWNKLLRTQAEMENVRKRSARELEQAHRFALERFATELLQVRDSLEMGLDAARGATDAEKLRQGTELTLKMLAQAMEKFNIEEIDPQGQPFDPERHQAMTTQENSQLPPNTVVTVMQKGYVLNERLLRPAMVIVSKTPEGGEHGSKA